MLNIKARDNMLLLFPILLTAVMILFSLLSGMIYMNWFI